MFFRRKTKENKENHAKSVQNVRKLLFSLGKTKEKQKKKNPPKLNPVKSIYVPAVACDDTTIKAYLFDFYFAEFRRRLVMNLEMFLLPSVHRCATCMTSFCRSGVPGVARPLHPHNQQQQISGGLADNNLSRLPLLRQRVPGRSRCWLSGCY